MKIKTMAHTRLLATLCLALMLPGLGFGEEAQKTPPPEPVPADGSSSLEPSPAASGEIPRFALNSPFDVDYKSPVVEKEKRLWATSRLYGEAPEFTVEKWLSKEPKIEGKYRLIEFWATWCPPCRRSLPLLNSFHKKFGDELVVIGVSDEEEATLARFKETKIEYFSATDTQARMKKALGVMGIPHIIVVEPGGYVVWEGFPFEKDYELTEEVLDKILEVGRKAKKEEEKE